MATTITGFDTSLLMSYYSAQLSTVAATSSNTSATSATTTNKNSATANDVTPWSVTTASQETRDASVLSLKNFIDTSKIPLTSGIQTDTKMEQDNQKLFALYSAVNNLSYLAVMAKRDGTTAGQRAGYNTRFQAGLTEIQNYIRNTNFNLFTLQAQQPSSSVTSKATVATPSFDYTGSIIASETTVSNPISGLSSSDSFNIAVTKGSATQNIQINLANVQGGLTMENVVAYVNQQLSSAGVATRFQKDLVSGTADTTDTSFGQYAIKVVPGGIEQVSLSAASTPSLYVAGTSGLSSASSTSAADSQGRLTKISNLSSPVADFSRTMSVSNGSSSATSSATSSLVDSSGNVYMLGNSTGSIGSQLNQGSQDVYLTKYDSAGNVTWSKLVGSAGTANGASMAFDPNGGLVVVGSTTGALTTSAINDGHQDSFAVKYDANGNQVWTAQIPTLNANSANAVSVDSSGNVYVGGQTSGVIGSGQTSSGGQDAYLVKLDNKGNITNKTQLGTSGTDSVAATSVTANGDLLVASLQNGHAILSKYAGGDITQTPAWTMDMGDLQSGGTIGGIVTNGSNIYISGTTRNGALNATATNSASGGTDAFVFAASDNGSSVTANRVTYVGTSGNETGANLTLGSDGTVYLAGSTNSAFPGQDRSAGSTNNMFVAAVSGSTGSLGWVRQYGGMDGQSTGAGIAFSANGSSVLDALGLPSGTVQGQANSDLTSATTLRAGDSFKVALQGTAARTFTITIDKGETLNSLVTKINAQFGAKGKASISYTSTGAALKLEVSAGVTAKLVSGPDNFDALGPLGISAQTLSKASSTSSSSSSASSSSSTTQTYALGLTGNMDISTATGAGAARAMLLNVLSAVQNVYHKSNNTASTASSTASTNTGTMSAAATAYNNAQNADMNLALNLLTA